MSCPHASMGECARCRAMGIGVSVLVEPESSKVLGLERVKVRGMTRHEYGCGRGLFRDLECSCWGGPSFWPAHWILKGEKPAANDNRLWFR